MAEQNPCPDGNEPWDCLNCLRVAFDLQEDQLALARKALAAAEEMRDSLTIESFALPRQCENIAAFDAAMAEVRKGEW